MIRFLRILGFTVLWIPIYALGTLLTLQALFTFGRVLNNWIATIPDRLAGITPTRDVDRRDQK
jgi:hypothetical protein